MITIINVYNIYTYVSCYITYMYTYVYIQCVCA